MITKIYIPILLVLLGVFTSSAENILPELESAQKAYSSGNNKEAIADYEKIIEAEGASSGILYNMGNAYTREKEYGPARVCYERAAKLNPNNSLIENNLNYVASRVDIQNRNDLKGQPYSVLPDEPWFFRSIYNLFAVNVASNTWAIMACVAFLLFILLLADYIFTKQVWVRKLGFFGGLSMFGVCVIFLIFAFTARHEARSHNSAVIMASKVELLSEPSSKGKPKTTMLNAGTKVEIIGTEGGSYNHPEWYNVHLNSDFSGWIKASEVEVI